MIGTDVGDRRAGSVARLTSLIFERHQARLVVAGSD
jgi:hypothetical protein